MYDGLEVPLPLAEMLHATLGPLTEVLESEDHPWVPLLKRVLGAYYQGRDDQMVAKYGPAVVDEIDVCTLQVAEEICNIVQEMHGEEIDFERWAQELEEERK